MINRGKKDKKSTIHTLRGFCSIYFIVALAAIRYNLPYQTKEKIFLSDTEEIRHKITDKEYHDQQIR